MSDLIFTLGLKEYYSNPPTVKSWFLSAFLRVPLFFLTFAVNSFAMKLRIKGNSVRLRLSKPDIQMLAHSGYLEEHTPFGNTTFVYALQSKNNGEELSADFDGSKMIIFIPASFLNDWAENTIVGFEAKVQVSHSDSLYLLVEKDFQCLDNKAEDQTANFENPKQPHQHE